MKNLNFFLYFCKKLSSPDADKQNLITESGFRTSDFFESETKNRNEEYKSSIYFARDYSLPARKRNGFDWS